MLEIVYILQRLIKRFIPSMITLLANQVTECFFPQHLPSSKKKKKVFSPWFIHSFISKMAKYKVVIVMVLTEFADSDDKKLCRRKTRKWVKMRRKSGYFQNIFQKLFQKLFLLVFHMCLKGTPLYRACFFFLLIMLVL